MPRGEHPNSRKNLTVNHHLTSEIARERGSKGGKKSAEVKKAYKSFKECFAEQIDDATRQELYQVLMKKAKMGNLKAFELLRDTLGEKPVDKVMVAEVEQSVIDEVEGMVNDDENTSS